MGEQYPVISVILSVYNTEKYVAAAIDSILRQTYHDFELIIIDDCSTDSSPAIIQNFQAIDKRIKVITNQHNSGLGVSLQRGIKGASGRFIARMDADDISPVDRFEKQVDYLNSHPQIMVLGGDFVIMNEVGEAIRDYIFPKDPEMMRWNMMLGSGLIVGSGAVMIRRELFDQIGPYSDLRAAQDFELWARLFDYDVLPLANLNNIVYYYREQRESITQSQNSLQERNAVQVRQKKIEQFLEKTVSQDVVLAYRHPAYTYRDMCACIQTWIEIYKKFTQVFQVNQETKKNIQTELISRLNKYSYIPPQKVNLQSRVSFWELLGWLPYDLSLRLIGYKMKWIMQHLR